MTRPDRRSAPKTSGGYNKGRTGERVIVTIDRLGEQGDGLAQIDGLPLFVLGALPGESVEASLTVPRGKGWAARTVRLLSERSSDRTASLCSLFGHCGGCRLHHLSESAQARLKTNRIRHALQRQGIACEALRPLVMSPPQTRRRASFAARRTAKGVVLGFHAAGSPDILPLEACPVLRPALVEGLPLFSEALANLLPPGGALDLILTETASGLDALLCGLGAPKLAEREVLAALADRLDLARLSWSRDAMRPAEVLAERRAPWLAFGGLRVVLPPGGFVQATLEGETALLASVTAALHGIAPHSLVFDLFAGLGTFSLPLAAAGYRVMAVEGLAEPLFALDRAARQARVTLGIQQRDLEQRPLLADELTRAAAVLLNPPRTGAKAQSQAIAGSNVPVIVAISCNPDRFARDSALLVAGGYRLDWVQPVDQFRWSPHVELVARFSR